MPIGCGGTRLNAFGASKENASGRPLRSASSAASLGNRKNKNKKYFRLFFENSRPRCVFLVKKEGRYRLPQHLLGQPHLLATVAIFWWQRTCALFSCNFFFFFSRLTRWERNGHLGRKQLALCLTNDRAALDEFNGVSARFPPSASPCFNDGHFVRFPLAFVINEPSGIIGSFFFPYEKPSIFSWFVSLFWMTVTLSYGRMHPPSRRAERESVRGKEGENVGQIHADQHFPLFTHLHTWAEKRKRQLGWKWKYSK